MIHNCSTAVHAAARLERRGGPSAQLYEMGSNTSTVARVISPLRPPVKEGGSSNEVGWGNKSETIAVRGWKNVLCGVGSRDSKWGMAKWT